MKKQCFKCGEVKPLDEFYKHKQMADGHVNKCKECNKLDVRKNRADNVEYYREYDNARGSRQNPEYFNEWKSKNKIKRAAHLILASAVKSGRVVKLNNCETCGAFHKRIHAHHDDYAIPLSVRWLCPSCHKKWHLEHGEGANAQ